MYRQGTTVRFAKGCMPFVLEDLAKWLVMLIADFSLFLEVATVYLSGFGNPIFW